MITNILLAWQERLIILYDIFVGGFFTAAFCFLLDFCLKPGNIFGAYRVWLSKGVLNRNMPNWKIKLRTTDDLSGLQEGTAPVQSRDEVKFKKMQFDKLIVDVASDFAYWEKPLGLCIICLNIYVAWGTIWFTQLPNLVCQHWYHVWVFIAYPAVSNFFLRRWTASTN